METARKPALKFILEYADDLRKNTFVYPLTESKLVTNGYRRNKIANQGVGVKGLDWANVSSDWVAELSNPAALFVMKNIIPNMKKYNLLWYWPTPKKKSEREAIKELADKKLIFRTETIGIYLVNPVKIWKGDPVTCVEATKDLLRTHRKPSRELIHDIRPGDKFIHELEVEQAIKLLDKAGDLIMDLTSAADT
jgi:hypothetical protein